MRNRLVKNIFCGAVICASALLLADDKVMAAEDKMEYTYADDGVVNGSWKKEYDVEAGSNYNVTITFTGTSSTATTISFGYDRVTDDQIIPNVAKSDDRSGLLNESAVAGKEEKRSFSVAAYNDKLQISANGNGKVVKVEVVKKAANKAGKTATLYTIGDSLVQTYAEKAAPQTGWGQMLQMYYDATKITCKNYALGGRSTGNYLRQGRLNEVLLAICPNDYVFIEFGHNDASSNNADRYVSIEDYKKNLTDVYIKAIKQRGAIPVIVTVCNRNDYNASNGAFKVSFGNYNDAMKQVAAATDTKLVDLNTMTVEYFSKLGKDLYPGVTGDIIYNHALPGAYAGDNNAKGIKDDTHLQKYGAMLVAGMVARGAKDAGVTGLVDTYIERKVPDSVPKAPTGIEKKTQAGSISRIKWKTANDADFYKVYVAETDGAKATSEYKLIGCTVVCDFSYEKATKNKSYMYKVVAINEKGESEATEYLFDCSQISTTPRQKIDVLADSDEEESGIKPLYIVLIVVGTIVVAATVVATILVLRKKKKSKVE